MPFDLDASGAKAKIVASLQLGFSLKDTSDLIRLPCHKALHLLFRHSLLIGSLACRVTDRPKEAVAEHWELIGSARCMGACLNSEISDLHMPAFLLNMMATTSVDRPGITRFLRLCPWFIVAVSQEPNKKLSLSAAQYDETSPDHHREAFILQLFCTSSLPRSYGSLHSQGLCSQRFVVEE